MKSTRLMMVFCACALAVVLLPADAAAQRGGGGGGGGGGAQPRGGGGSGGGSGQRGGGGGGGGSQAVPRTHPPYVNGGHYRPYYGGYYPYYSPFYGFYGGYGYGFGFGFGLGYSAYYAPYYAGYAGYASGYPYYAQYPYPYPYSGYYGNWASARLEVKPRDAQVYVDGYLVGSVDSFDGVFQRLDLPTGEHEIVAYMKGYRTYRQRTLFRPGESYHFKGVLEPLPAGAPEEPAPQPSANSRPEPYQNPNRDPRDPYYRDPAGQDPNRQGPPPDDRGRTMPMPERPGDYRAPESNSFGTLNIRVQPGDATVIIDGERWDSPDGGSRLSVQLSAGPHRVEVRKDGFKPYTSTVQIRPGDAQLLNISLPPGQ